MTLPTSGQLTFGMILQELGRGGPLRFSDADARSLCGIASGPVKLSDFYGKSTVINYEFSEPGTYTIPGSPGKSSALVRIRAGGGGGGGGGQGGNGDSRGAGGGGGGAGGAGEEEYGLIHFPVGTSLTVVVGDGGQPGVSTTVWKIIDDSWRTGGDGSMGSLGHPSYIYDVNGNLLITTNPGKGGEGGKGGGPHNDSVAAGGLGGGGYPNGNNGAGNNVLRGGAGGTSGAYGETARSVGGMGGDGCGFTGEDGDGKDSGVKQLGKSGTVGYIGHAIISMGGQDPAAPWIDADELNCNIAPNASYASGPVGVVCNVAGGVREYIYYFAWNVISTNGPQLSNPNSQTCSITGAGTITISCTVGDVSGKSAVTNQATLTIASGGSTGGGGGGSGGGGETCVAIESFMTDGERAENVVVSSLMRLADEVTLEEGIGIVTYAKTNSAQGYRIQTSSGAALRCSDTAPIPTKNGLLTPKHLLGEFVPVLRDEVTTWEEVISVEDIGIILVRHITVGDKCFWAGETVDAFILHHNKQVAEN